MGFDKIYKDYTEKYPELISEQEVAAPAPVDPGMAPPPAGDPAAQQAPMPPPEPEPLTPEGKKVIIELARKALLYDPAQVPEDVRSELAMNEATPENAEQVLELINRVVGETVEPAEEG